MERWVLVFHLTLYWEIQKKNLIKKIYDVYGKKRECSFPNLLTYSRVHLGQIHGARMLVVWRYLMI